MAILRMGVFVCEFQCVGPCTSEVALLGSTGGRQERIGIAQRFRNPASFPIRQKREQLVQRRNQLPRQEANSMHVSRETIRRLVEEARRDDTAGIRAESDR